MPLGEWQNVVVGIESFQSRLADAVCIEPVLFSMGEYFDLLV
jgi:hypothetical protein